jgi:pimeloyl-ACP methyl ester carboxylesterase
MNLAAQVMPLFARLNNRRDIVFVDQRGTGRSAPLECEDTRRQPLADQADPQAQLTQIRRCREALLEAAAREVGRRPALLHTTIAMQDLDAVRAQLGAERIDLVGGSYGTRAGLEYLRQFPQHVRRSVLGRRGAARHGPARQHLHRRPGRVRRDGRRVRGRSRVRAGASRPARRLARAAREPARP